MKKKAIRLVFSVVAIVILFAATAISVSAVEYDYAYTTNDYNVNVVLTDENVYEITETIAVNFRTDRHGIYRYIPTKGDIFYYENNSEEEKKVSLNLRIKDVSVDGYDYSYYYENGNAVIKVGDPDVTVRGAQTYVIKYKIHCGADKASTEYDLAYINLFGTEWPNYIERASFSMTFPTDVPAETAINSGAYGEIESNVFDITIEGNTITGVAQNGLAAGEGATLISYLPEGSLVGKDMQADLLMWFLIIGAVLIVIAIVLYFIFGRDEKVVPIMSVAAPASMTSAEAGYIIDNTSDDKDLLSMIVYWADKGYLAIEEQEKGDFLLHKLSDLPDDAKPYEKTMFYGLFKMAGTEVLISDLKGSFYKTLATAKVMLKGLFTSKNNLLYDAKSAFAANAVMWMGIIFFVVSTCVNAAVFGAMGSELKEWLFVIGAALFISVFYGALMAFSKKLTFLTGGKKVRSMVGRAIMMIAVTAIYVVATALFAQVNIILSIVSSVITMVIIFIACAVQKRTEKLNLWIGALLGLKDFIELAERDRLETFVQEDPQIFYHILPYAYVMGISDKWIKQFEGLAIQPPSWYTSPNYMGGFNTMMFMHSFNNCMSDMRTNLTVPPASSSGGGFSGGGGGGFSGGGIGGGGGGSW